MRSLTGSVYVPNGGKDYAAKLRFLEAMEHYAAECRSRGVDLILCGDMNVTRTDQDVHPKERKPNVIGQRADERELFERVLESGGLMDVGRVLDPDNDRLFTWWPPWRNMRQSNIGWRLDYILASQPAPAASAIRASALTFSSRIELRRSLSRDARPTLLVDRTISVHSPDATGPLFEAKTIRIIK